MDSIARYNTKSKYVMLMTTPLSIRYRENLASRDFISDPEQERILRYFEKLYQALDHNPAQNMIESFVQRLTNPKLITPKGIYLWGNVGRGKTYLMDIFFDCLTSPRKKRVHFHRFMTEVHGLIKELGNKSQPLNHIAKDIGKNNRVLCIDELFVTDIGDAMILSALFPALLKEKVTLVIASNIKPQDLYSEGLHRDKFIPTIDLIKDHTEVLQLDGDTDYRFNSRKLANRYIQPHDHTTETYFQKTFSHLTSGALPQITIIQIDGRAIQAQGVSQGVIWFDFDNLCRASLSTLEFSKISKSYHTLILSNIPILGSEDDDAVRRLIELIDQLYDRRVNVIVSAMSSPEELYTGTRILNRFQRTISRLAEFQSDKYIKEPHRP